LTLSAEGEPITQFAANEVTDWPVLALDISFDFTGNPRKLDLEIVEYGPDGFAYYRRNSALEVESIHIGDTYWWGVGQSPGDDWTPGRHYIYVYHEGQKVAEVVYEVTVP
jgi:hypothetical protein